MRPEEQILLAPTGAGTPMGELLRRYWMPVVLSSEIEAAGAPVRVRILGEDLIAWRDSQGRPGLFHEACSHRGASLYFGKNEDCGLRCWYHGWKYDVDGNCIDMPNEPPQTQFKDRVKHRAYPCRERAGAVWAYLGPRETISAFPAIEWTEVPEAHVHATKRLQECHWLTGLEGDLDSSHLAFLHGRESLAASPRHQGALATSREWIASDRTPKMEVMQLPGGVLHSARREADAENYYWRIGEWFLPFFTTIPGHPGDTPLGGHAWVPIDDRNVWAFAFSWHPQRPLRDSELDFMHKGLSMHSLMQPESWVPAHNKTNGYADPASPPTKQPWQKIKLFQDQDVAITESIGVFDRTLESLGSTDTVIVQVRRRLMAAARALQQGDEPRRDPADYRFRPLSCLLPRQVSAWAEAVAEAIDARRPDTWRPSV
jgi:phthalate 4,5-dioxygenase